MIWINIPLLVFRYTTGLLALFYFLTRNNGVTCDSSPYVNDFCHQENSQNCYLVLVWITLAALSYVPHLLFKDQKFARLIGRLEKVIR